MGGDPRNSANRREGAAPRDSADARKGAERLLAAIRDARRAVAFTGAGVSTISGIRDFRGPGGLYGEMDAEKIFGREQFDLDPSLFYKLAGPFVYSFGEKEPSVAHVALAELEARGLLRAVITQNIDMLHQKAGSRNVIELHGSPAMHHCLRCAGVRVGYEEAARVVRAGGMPLCPECGRALKPAITFFGERLPAGALREATGESQEADLMLVLGTSLAVYPAASMPDHALSRGGRVVIANNMPTHLDSRAAMRFGELAPLFEALRDLLRG